MTKSSFICLLVLALGISSCTEPAAPPALTRSEVIQAIQDQLPQPVLMRDNLPKERNNHRLDSLAWNALGMQDFAPYSVHSGFFALGKILDLPGDFTSLLLYEEQAYYQKAWIVNYSPSGDILDYRMVYFQEVEGSANHHSYLRDNILELERAEVFSLKYRLLPSGHFLPY